MQLLKWYGLFALYSLIFLILSGVAEFAFKYDSAQAQVLLLASIVLGFLTEKTLKRN